MLLTSVALGAVLGGALTYIGNGPNFMVKSVADAVGVETPSFGGYVVQSLTYLVPVFAAMALIFLTDAWLWRALGIAIAVALLLRAALLARRHR